MTPEDESTPTGQAVAPEGQVEEAQGQVEGQTLSEAPFYQYQFDGDREPTVFRSQDDLAKFLRDSSLRRSDYTRKTQDLAKQREEIEGRSKELDTTLSTYSRYKEIDDWLKTDKGRRAMEVIEQQMADPGYEIQEAKSYADEKVSALEEELNALKDAQSQREQEAQRDQILERLSGKYGDFNRDTVLERIKSLSDSPEGTEMEDFIDLIYWAEKGKGTVADLERKIAQNAGMKQSARSPMPSTGASPPVSTGAKTIEEAAEIARQELGEL